MSMKRKGSAPRLRIHRQDEWLAVSGLALAIACCLPGQVHAANYTVSTQAELAAAINAANAGTDASSTITLAGNIAFTSSAMLPTPSDQPSPS